MCELQGNVQVTLSTICLTGAQTLPADARVDLRHKAVRREPALKAAALLLQICVLAEQKSPQSRRSAAHPCPARCCRLVLEEKLPVTLNSHYLCHQSKRQRISASSSSSFRCLSQTSPLQEVTQNECLFLSGRFISLASAEIICLGAQILQRSD